MRHLQKPLPDIPVNKIYRECVQGFVSKDLRERLLACAEMVETDTLTYEEQAPDGLVNFNMSPLPAITQNKEMVKIYEQKFARLNSPGRAYYDRILAQSTNGICPLCSVRSVSTLDHYLPKNQYPTLVITPVNLIPSCRDCNTIKSTYVMDCLEEAPLHPYFDDVSNDRWLEATLHTDKTVIYHVECPSCWSDTLKARVQKHMELYCLQRCFGIKAAEHIANCKWQWNKLLATTGEYGLLSYIQDSRNSAEHNELNSWIAALYRGMELQLPIVLEWLNDVLLE